MLTIKTKRDNIFITKQSNKKYMFIVLQICDVLQLATLLRKSYIFIPVSLLPVWKWKGGESQWMCFYRNMARPYSIAVCILLLVGVAYVIGADYQ